MLPTRPSLTVIIPTLNEEACLKRSIANVRACLPTADLLIVDGGSRDNTIRIAHDLGVRILSSEIGRGTQLDTGAQHASSDLMLFLHADTLLPANADELLRQFFGGSEERIATFRLSFDHPNWFLRTCAWFTRFDSVFTRFGDQGIAITRKLYRQIGGFPHWPLFEDVEFLRRARRHADVHSLPSAVTTSSRRFRKHGVLRQQWFNALLLCRFLLGTSPHILAKHYRS